MSIIERLAKEHNSDIDNKISPKAEEKIISLENLIERLTSRVQHLEMAFLELNFKLKGDNDGKGKND